VTHIIESTDAHGSPVFHVMHGDERVATYSHRHEAEGHGKDTRDWADDAAHDALNEWAGQCPDDLLDIIKRYPTRMEILRSTFAERLRAVAKTGNDYISAVGEHWPMDFAMDPGNAKLTISVLVDHVARTASKSTTPAVAVPLGDYSKAREALVWIIDNHAEDTEVPFCRECGAAGGRWPCATNLEAKAALSLLPEVPHE